jgi:hypothetical protein
VFPNPEKIRAIVVHQNGFSGWVQFDSHSAARKAVCIEKNPYVSVTWPETKVAIPHTVDEALDSVNADRSVRGPAIFIVPDAWSPQVEREIGMDEIFAGSLAHCLNFHPSPSANEPAWIKSCFTLADLAELEGFPDLAFEIYGQVAITVANLGCCCLTKSAIESRVRMAIIAATMCGDYEFANDLLIMEASAIENFFSEFINKRSTMFIPGRTEFVSGLIEISKNLDIRKLFIDRKRYTAAGA